MNTNSTNDFFMVIMKSCQVMKFTFLEEVHSLPNEHIFCILYAECIVSYNYGSWYRYRIIGYHGESCTVSIGNIELISIGEEKGDKNRGLLKREVSLYDKESKEYLKYNTKLHNDVFFIYEVMPLMNLLNEKSISQSNDEIINAFVPYSKLLEENEELKATTLSIQNKLEAIHSIIKK